MVTWEEKHHNPQCPPFILGSLSDGPPLPRHSCEHSCPIPCPLQTTHLQLAKAGTKLTPPGALHKCFDLKKHKKQRYWAQYPAGVGQMHPWGSYLVRRRTPSG